MEQASGACWRQFPNHWFDCARQSAMRGRIRFVANRPGRNLELLKSRAMHGVTRAKTIAGRSTTAAINVDSAAVLAARRLTLATGAAGARARFVHDPADGARAPPAPGAAAEAAIDLASRCRLSLGGEYRANVVVAQYVARTDDHEARRSQPVSMRVCYGQHRRITDTRVPARLR